MRRRATVRGRVQRPQPWRRRRRRSFGLLISDLSVADAAASRSYTTLYDIIGFRDPSLMAPETHIHAGHEN